VNPSRIVAILLEQEDRADSDPIERPAFPRGFTATHSNGDVFEVRFSRRRLELSDRPRTTQDYRFTRHWTDPYTSKRRSIEGHYGRADSPEKAQVMLDQKAGEFQANGWTVDVLP